MARACSVCNHPDRTAIDARLVTGASFRDVARQYGLGKDAVGRHRGAHVSAALIRVAERREARRAEQGPQTALDRLEDLYGRAVTVLQRAEDAGNTAQQLGAIREARGLVETIARVTGELRESPAIAVNVLASPEIAELTGALMASLQPYPEARIAAARALEGLEVGVPA